MSRGDESQRPNPEPGRPGLLQQITALVQILSGNAPNPLSNYPRNEELFNAVDENISANVDSSPFGSFVDYLNIMAGQTGLDTPTKYRLALQSAQVAVKSGVLNKEALLTALSELINSVNTERSNFNEAIDADRTENVTARETRAAQVRSEIAKLNSELQKLDQEILAERSRIDQQASSANTTFEGMLVGISVIQSGVGSHL